MQRDPVCGMQVDENKAQQSNYQGKSYYFCSPGCKEKFDREPQRYAGSQEETRKSTGD